MVLGVWRNEPIEIMATVVGVKQLQKRTTNTSGKPMDGIIARRK